MTTTTTPPAPHRGAPLLPGSDGPQEKRVLKGVAALVGSLLLLLGVPAALVLLVGNPLPTSAPSRDWLTAQVDAELIIKVIAVLVWVVWVHFVVCFLTEWRAVRAGRMPGRVVMGGGSQVLARQLVAAILLLAGGASVAQGVSGALASSSPEPVRQPPVTQVVQGAQARPQADHQAGRHGHATKVITVQPPEGRHHDTLWGISERTLGDPFRWREVYELNKDRPQPDGGRLTDADLIRPGWQVLLPGDAQGPGVRVLDAAPASPGSATVGASSTAAARTADSSPIATTGGGASTDGEQAVEDSALDGDLAQLVAGGGLVLAGIVTALAAKRGPYGTPTDAEGALRLAANPGRADLVDRALRVLAESRVGQGQPLPDLAVVYVDDDQVVAHPVGRPEAPAQPWRPSEDGGSWTVRAEDLRGVRATAAAPYPALVNVATSHGFDLLVDLEYASGLVSVGGDDAIAREVVTSLAVDLATHAWSDSVAVTMVGFGNDLSDLAPTRISSATSLDEALASIEQALDRAGHLLSSLGVDGVLSGRSRARFAELAPQVLVLSAPPTAEEAQRIRALVTGGRTAFAAVCVGDAVGARWRFAVDATGRIDLGVLGASGEARRYTHTAQEAVRRLLARTTEEAADRTREIAEAPARLVPAGGARGAASPGAAVTVRLLGPVAVAAPGPVEDARAAVLTELVAMAALHPQGLHPAALSAGLWPRGVTEDVVARTVHDAQRWLGVDVAGNPRLRQGDDGLYHLADDVYVDWADLQSCAVATDGGEVASLTRGLSLGTGEAFSGTPAGRYGWLAFHRCARDARALVASMAGRAAELLVAGGDRTGAASALRRGLVLVPTAESLWRELLRLHGGDDPTVQSLVGEMHATLPDHRFEAETEALVAHLAPGA
ncbi:hypothetical protein [Nocardioides sp. CER19]|uniref:LysM peptidoglycan-binding domain-containing protein n=1 Tax=Nocardioides sp. CER19 TaxID=3038538 RepID=UPI00244955D5|nr:hypothetical protein [Nocardioides sp. CER19]MDH2413242.1 hypothetical protein [Nocardioides sp. CER19]